MAPAESGMLAKDCLIVGKISGVYGVGGELKVFSYTKPRENIFLYHPWLIENEDAWSEIQHNGAERKGRSLTVKFSGIDDRDSAGRLIHRRIAVRRSQLPELKSGEYYWADLLRMDVLTLAGDHLGKIVEIQPTGANDVLVVQGEKRHLIPFVKDEVIRQVSLDSGVVMVEWQTD